jgi:putative transposase
MIISVILSRMRYRTSYDTSIKHLYRKGLEEAIPLSLRKKIPRNTIHRWRNENEDKYTGCELNDLAHSELAMLKEFVRSKNARRIFMTYVRIGRFIQSVTNEKVIKQQFKKNKADLIDVVERARTALPLKQVLNCFGLTQATYNLWVLGMYSDCGGSAIDWCLSRQPHQLMRDEVETMERLLNDEEFSHWPISSLAHYARRNDLLHASPSTWYKYARILGIRRAKPAFRKRKNEPGIKAVRCNQVWHADVTQFKIGLKTFYIYLLVDNYSRKVLSHMVSSQLSAKNRVETIKMAYEQEFGSIQEDVMLLVDGGSENHNAIVNTYVNNLKNLTKYRALHDIRFGNTQIEAHNKILKQGWLYRKQIDEEEKLKKELENFVYEFNEVRPHHAIGGMTPSEMHEGCENYFDDTYRSVAREARKTRCRENKCNTCSNCPNTKYELKALI